MIRIKAFYNHYHHPSNPRNVLLGFMPFFHLLFLSSVLSLFIFMGKLCISQDNCQQVSFVSFLFWFIIEIRDEENKKYMSSGFKVTFPRNSVRNTRKSRCFSIDVFVCIIWVRRSSAIFRYFWRGSNLWIFFSISFLFYMAIFQYFHLRYLRLREIAGA